MQYIQVGILSPPVKASKKKNCFRKCPALDKEFIREACESNMAVKTYIEGKVPSTVQLEVFEPCSQCHAL
jgi:hypothetical protein